MAEDESLTRFNQATYEDLVGIEGIGHKLTQAILTFRGRQEHGQLTNWQLLHQVYGLGEHRLRLIRERFEDQITTDTSKENAPPPEFRPRWTTAHESVGSGAAGWKITSLPQQRLSAPPRWFWWLIGLGVPVALIYGFFLHGITRQIGYREQTSALQATLTASAQDLQLAQAALIELDRQAAGVGIEVTRQVTVVVETTPLTPSEAGGSSVRFTGEDVPVDHLCSEVDPPCIYMVKAGDVRTGIATASAFGDSCRWPEILDLNRTSLGVYPSLSVGFPLFLPEAVERGTYPPMINEGGEWHVIPACPIASGTPCLHTVEDGLYGNRYSEIARKFYQDPSLAEIIAQANRESDCSPDPIALRPGAQIVIPVPVRRAP